ncbi:hypothetical protein CW731_06675 [Polaribacter sp. ALD11]|uniref:tetratricopeptide repeat protein n=1 Tax=Polaribacter sp. ALD11 TaxID=2058137 RepID=UPI000C2FF53F|nr:hypothetical protein [Polaribacter sp. ALD11]AUC84990.1 hypothetical protein CW731_06675 [Polaribacter sp. ALD11]
MLKKAYKDKIKDIDVLYRNTIDISTNDSLYITSYTKKMEQWALANDDNELALEAELLRGYTNWYIYGRKNLEIIQDLIYLAYKGKKQKVFHIEARAVNVIATHYWSIKNYESAFEWLLQLAKILEEVNSVDFPNMAAHLNFIGRCYYNFQDYTTALIYYQKSGSLEKTAFNSKAVLEAQNTVGLCYQKLGELKLAKPYFLKVIEDTSEYKNIVWKGIASGNLGYNYYLDSKYEKAIPFFKIDIKNALKINEPGLAAGSIIPLADIYLKQNKFADSKLKIDQARLYIQQSGQTDRLLKLYPIMSNWYAANKQAILSAAYLDSTLIAVHAYSKKYSSLKLLRASQKVEAKERALALEKVKAESKQKLTQRNFIILLITVLLATSFVYFWFRNKYLLKEKQVKELALENTQKALESAKSQLKSLTLKVRQDNNLIAEFQKEKNATNNPEFLLNLKSQNILTLSDWERFQKLFKEGYPNYIKYLRAYYSDLSQAEIRCLCLEKLSLNNNEMGLLLGVSTNTIRVTKHRIRKKLNLQSQDDLGKFVQNFRTNK